ncbi:hypothetical protein SAMN05660293_05664 [Dyadobacter psychrophilus]|uniref:Uncharacterized protein n=1 Tax=Dyadobacter psychrophilus TaxID=651661 RepID=A0A1T5HIM4_9BACT|nr:hypothetical protein SAMN05660293_05664 [Dyadobacter psychrophilus]
MNNNRLKHAWEQQKMNFEDPLISEDDILSIIHQEFSKQQKLQRLLYNASSVIFLLIFCQTC